MEALQTGEPLHAREFVRRQYKIQVRWSKRAYTRRQRDVAHFRPREATQLVRGGLALSARDMAVPLGHGRDVEALVRQSAQNNWMPEPDAVAVPSEEEMQGLVAAQIGKMNGRVSP
eukprot:1146230-Pelagomonas_calceolata.AAC.2